MKEEKEKKKKRGKYAKKTALHACYKIS